MQVYARPDGHTYYDDPKRKKPEEHRVERETAVYDFSMRYHESTPVRPGRRAASCRSATCIRAAHHKDAYSDFWRQQVTRVDEVQLGGA